jgi:uncharacterized protein YgiM (DUF1202 family)
MALLCGLAGCARGVSGPKTGYYVVSVPQASFYKSGPAQSFGPDFVLKKGDRVTMLDRQWGFSRVLTDNGVAGYIANEEIAPTAAAAAQRGASAARGNVPGAGLPAGRAGRNQVQDVPGNPLFNVNDVPLPMLDEPAKPRPQFRTGAQPGVEGSDKPKPSFR